MKRTFDPGRYKRRTPWDARLDDALLQMTDRGWTTREIADRLGFDVTAVRRRRCLVLARVGGRNDLTALEVSQILGRPRVTVNKWLRRGKIRSTLSGQTRSGRGAERAISRESLKAFLADQTYWPYWLVSDIRPGYWRELVGELRGNVRLVTVAEAAQRASYSESWIRHLVAAGRLTAVLGPKRRCRGLALHIPEAALNAFVEAH